MLSSNHRSVGSEGRGEGRHSLRVRLMLGLLLLGGVASGVAWILSRQSELGSGIAAGRTGWRTSAEFQGVREKTAGLRRLRLPVPAGPSYVGDAACTRCHAEIARSFAGHPMGRSLRPAADLASSGVAPGWDRFSFTEGNLRYEGATETGAYTHIEGLQDDRGRAIAHNRGTIRYALGAGQQGVSFLLERGEGFLFASPVTNYPSERRWDLSPGYARDNPHFERPARPGCLYCHSN